MAVFDPLPTFSAYFLRPIKSMEQDSGFKEREFYRYYTHRARSITPPCQEPPPLQYDAPRPCEDHALTAMAQLGALRLNTRRCLISFFDRRDCFVLTEATRTLSLATGQAEIEADRLCWGNTRFPKAQSICYYTLNLPSPFQDISANYYDNIPSLIVNDLSKDERFKDYPFVRGFPFSRFYAGVPIRSPNNVNIGTYCVLDENPRDGLSLSEVQFLKDMASTVMHQLEMTRAADDNRQGKIMVKSLGYFAEGKSSPVNWWQTPWDTDHDCKSSSVSTDDEQDQDSVMAAAPETIIQMDTLDEDTEADPTIPTLVKFHVDNPHKSQDLPKVNGSKHSSRLLQEDRSSDETVQTYSSLNEDRDEWDTPEIQAAFNRAAKMIVDATEVDGVIFLDAKTSTFGGLVDEDFSIEHNSEIDKLCAILGSALSKKYRDSAASSNLQRSVPENILRHLLRLYSLGQIFVLDNVNGAFVEPTYGNIAVESHSMSSTQPSLHSELLHAKEAESFLQRAFPKARSLAIYPLWDQHRERWFASTIVWTSDPIRVFTNEQEMSYLAAFGNSLMAEVARLDTKMADAAKADFISSISHELRSPLHGILGMTDLLKDCSLDNRQAHHVATIEACGQTLLETINHVLDFAKINSLTRESSKKQLQRHKLSVNEMVGPGSSHMNDVMNLIKDVDVSLLTEEVVESVFAGFAYTSAQNQYQNSAQAYQHVSIVLDLSHSSQHIFRTQPGAWRRIIMNLFGNSLKYTQSGFIKVKLESEKLPGSDELWNIRLIVSDSGIGMSREYVNARLFHAFAQENPLSQGVGLGLAIVAKIVESLGGRVEVRSEKLRGTKFIITCPVKSAFDSSLSPSILPGKERERCLRDIRQRVQGMRVRFDGFEQHTQTIVESSKLEAGSRASLKAIESVCLNWFSMSKYDVGMEGPKPEFVIATEDCIASLREEIGRNPAAWAKVPVILICQSASARSKEATSIPGVVHECISRPVGPHKMAKALLACLARQADKSIEPLIRDSPKVPDTVSLILADTVMTSGIDTIADQSAERPSLLSTGSAPQLALANPSNSIMASIDSTLGSLNCLCVDDNPINLRILRTFVTKLGHRHVLASNGLEALNSYKTASSSSAEASNLLSTPLGSALEPFDVILMDVQMPEMDGLEATRQIRAYEKRHGLPNVSIIAVTGRADNEVQQEAQASGVNLFLIKPMRLADLGVILKGIVKGQKDVDVSESEVIEKVNGMSEKAEG